jgi:hypothetical protein
MLAETLVMPNRWFEKCALSKQTRAGIATLFRGLVERLPDAEATIGEVLGGDLIKLKRFHARLTPPAAES